MQQPRTRLVNFRVTDEEYDRLRTASDQQGARCISDYARTIMLGRPYLYSANLAGAPYSNSDDDRFEAFDRRLTALERSIARLTDALAAAPGELASTRE
jgi:hypothetical protein